MKLFKNILTISSVFLFCFSCKATDNIIVASTDSTSYNMQDLRRKLEALEAHVYTVLPVDRVEAKGENKESSNTLDDFDENKAKAQLSIKLEDLRTEITALRGQVEEAVHGLEQQNANVQKLEQQLTATMEQANATKEAVAALKSAEPPIQQAPAPPPLTNEDRLPTETEKIRAEIKSLEPKDAYARSKEYISQGEYEKAEVALKTFIEAFPEDALVGATYYYLGELYYIQKNFKEAVSVFAEGYQKQPHGDKAPDSLVKMAQSFDALKQSKEACATLAQLHKSFPKLNANLKAVSKKLSAQLKCRKDK